MKPSKIHWIGSVGWRGYQETACGKFSGFATRVKGEFCANDGLIFEAEYLMLKNVTCKSCIRVINSRGPVRAHDKYRTPASAVAPLAPYLVPGMTFAEPCAGDGRLVRHLEALGLRCVYSGDAAPDDWLETPKNALTADLGDPGLIITNPPWTRRLLHPMISRFTSIAPTWLLFDAAWKYTAQARPFLPLCSHIVPIGRVRWIEGSEHNAKDDCAWYRFAADTFGRPQFMY